MTIGGGASGDSAVKAEILIGGAIALAIATAIGVYYAQTTVGNVRRLQEAARKAADGDFETTIPVASAGQLAPLARTFNEMQRRLAELDSARSRSSPTPRTSCERRSSASAASSSCSKTRTRAPRSAPSSSAPCASRSSA